MKPDRLKIENGFSLIEIMVSFSILTLAFVAIMSSFPRAISITKSAESSTMAAYLAQQKTEELCSLGYDNIATGTIEALNRLSATTTDPLYHFERQTDVSYVDGDLSATSSDTGIKKISVTVYYADSATRSRKPYNVTILISQR